MGNTWTAGMASPNPSGRPPVPAALRCRSDELLDIQLLAVMSGRIPLAPAGEGDDPETTDDGQAIPASKTQVVPPKVRMDLAEKLLDRIFGRASQVVEIEQQSNRNAKLAKLYARMDDAPSGG